MIPFIISNDPGFYVDDTVTTNHRNGLGRLTECISCKITENLEGAKTAVLQVPMNALHADKLVREGLLMFDDNEDTNQLWRINTISKSYKSGIIELNCNHISYDMNKLGCRPFNATGVANILEAMRTHYISYIPFHFVSSIVNDSANVSIQVPTYYREIIGGIPGNIIETLGCEVEWDNLYVRFLSRRGSERNIAIRYGVNILDAKQEESMTKTVSRVYGYAKKGDDPVVVGHPIGSSSGSYYRIGIVDLTGTFANTDTINAQTVTEHTQTWVDENDPFTPEIGFTVNYLSLKSVDPSNYASLYSLQLGDTVSVILPLYGEFRARVTELVYDVLNDRIESIQIGNYKESLAETIDTIRKNTGALKSYPVGSYYTSASKTNPAAIFGGEWTLMSSTANNFTFKRIK